MGSAHFFSSSFVDVVATATRCELLLCRGPTISQERVARSSWTELAFWNRASRLKKHNDQGLGSDDYPGPWRVAAVVPIPGGRDAAQRLEAAWKAVGKQWDARLSATLDPRDVEGGAFAPPADALWARLPGVLRRLQQLCVLAADPEHAAMMSDVKLTWTPNQVLLLTEGLVVKAQSGLKGSTDDAEDTSVTAALASLPHGVVPERHDVGLTPRAYKGFIGLHVRPLRAVPMVSGVPVLVRTGNPTTCVV